MQVNHWALGRILAAAIFGLIAATGLSFAQETDEPAPAEDVSETSADDEGTDTDTAPADGEMTEGEDGDDAALDGEEGEDTEAGDEAVDGEEEVDAPRDWGRLQPVADLVEAGGAVIIILIALSILSLMVILVKLIQFRILRVGDHKFTNRVSDLLRDDREDEALDLLENRKGVIARVMETALRGKVMGADEDATRQETERVAKAKLDGLEQGLPLLNLIATVSPLLGLLGTVLGMIEAFQQLESAGDRVDPAILSGGIWEALLTTAAGLSVAIPAAAFFTWLQRSVDVAAQHMEDAAIRVFTSSLYKQGGATDADDDA